MWHAFCGLIALDKGLDAYEKFSGIKKDEGFGKNFHVVCKCTLDLATMCAGICYMLGITKWKDIVRGEPSKN